MDGIKLIQSKGNELKDVYEDLLGQFCVEPEGKDSETILNNMKQYDLEHTILDRQDKVVGTGANKKVVVVAKLIVSLQKKIVEMAIAFLFGNPVKLICDNKEDKAQEAFEGLKDVWKKNKLDSHNRKLARRLFIETKVAELFYIVKTDEGNQIKTMLLSNENGDEIYPHFNDYGDMDVFVRKYVTTNEEGKEISHADIYTSEQIIKGTHEDGWTVTTEKNLIGKIPVIYYEQEACEWNDVQTLIDRIESMISKNADTNDYFSSPAVVAKGKLKTVPEKDEVGKFFQIEAENIDGKATYGSLEYLTWDNAPEAYKTEYEILKDIIYSQTSTPDLSFNNVKGTSNLSGIALKFMFLDSILKSKNKQEIFGEGLERRINLLKVMVGKVANVKFEKGMKDLEINIEFQDALPENIFEVIEMLSTAVGGKSILSTEGAVRRNPLVDNPEDEIEKIEEEAKKDSALEQSFNTGED